MIASLTLEMFLKRSCQTMCCKIRRGSRHARGIEKIKQRGFFGSVQRGMQSGKHGARPSASWKMPNWHHSEADIHRVPFSFSFFFFSSFFLFFFFLNHFYFLSSLVSRYPLGHLFILYDRFDLEADFHRRKGPCLASRRYEVIMGWGAYGRLLFFFFSLFISLRLL